MPYISPGTMNLVYVYGRHRPFLCSAPVACPAVSRTLQTLVWLAFLVPLGACQNLIDRLCMLQAPLITCSDPTWMVERNAVSRSAQTFHLLIDSFAAYPLLLLTRPRVSVGCVSIVQILTYSFIAMRESLPMLARSDV